MKPRLYEKGTKTFSTGGICSLADALTLEITEALNGEFELKMQYPVSVAAFAELSTGRIILAKPNVYEEAEPFEIYAISKPLSGKVTVWAEHVSYRANKIVIAPFQAADIGGALSAMQTGAVNENPFTLTTNMATVNEINSNVPITLKHGIVGRVIPLYGGEVKYNRYTIRVLSRRGADRGFSVRYGKNLIDARQDEDVSEIYDGVYPYYNIEETEYTDAEYVELPEKTVLIGTSSKRIMPLNLTGEFEDMPDEEELREKTMEYLAENDINAGVLSIDVDFVLLSGTEEYKDIMPLEEVMLGDTVSIFIPNRGISVRERCVKTVYDALRGRYKKITIGDQKRTVADTVAEYEARLTVSETKIGEQGRSIAKLIVKTDETKAEVIAIAEWVGDGKSGAKKSLAEVTAKAEDNGAKIALVVSTTEDGENYVNGSFLIQAINGESAAVISADRIDLNGYVTVNDAVKVVSSTSADASLSVGIRNGELKLLQYYNAQTFSAELNAAFYQSRNPYNGNYFVSGNANTAVSGAAQVGWLFGNYIMFANDNAQMVGTWLSASSEAVTSDEGKKHDIKELDERFSVFFDTVRPAAYKYNDGTSGRDHTGFIANEVETALAAAGISTQEFAGFVEAEIVSESGETELVKCLRYEEFIAVLWREVQILKGKIT